MERKHTHDVVLPHDVYAAELEMISEVNFTRREIDVIACILSGKTSKKIASFLSIAPKTVENHVRNIMLKMGCRTQESIIESIEKSNHYILVKKHYTNLLIQHEFELELKRIANIITGSAYDCLIVYDRDNKQTAHFFNYFFSNLQLAGIKIELKAIDKSNPEAQLTAEIKSIHGKNLIYHVDPIQDEFLKEDYFKKLELSKLKNSALIFISISHANSHPFSRDVLGFEYISLYQEKSYYSFLFNILQILTPNIKIDANIFHFKKRQIIFQEQNHANSGTSQEATEKQAFNYHYLWENILKNKHVAILSIGIASLFLSGILFFYFKNSLNSGASSADSKDISTHSSPILFKQKNIALIEWNLPRQDHIFFGRKQLLDELENKLHSNVLQLPPDKGNSSQGISTVSVCAGLGGVGKTQLALEYMRHSNRPYTLKAWFFAESIDQLKQQYIEFAKALGYKGRDFTIDAVLPYVKNWLSRNPGWLLVYDNVTNYEAIKDFLPNNGGSIILTTRQRKWRNGFKTLDIDIMDENESLALIQSLIKREILPSEMVSAKELVRVLGYLPLALAHAGSYIHENSISIQNYLDLYRNNEQQLLADNTLPEGTDSLPIAITWNISLEAIVKESQSVNQPSLALHLLTACAYMAPEKIPKDLLLSWLKKGYPNISAPDLLLQKLINQLWQYSLINRGDKDITIHRLVQSVIRIQHKEQTKKQGGYFPPLTLEWYNELLKSAHTEFAKQTSNLEAETRKAFLLPHLQALATHYEQLWPKQLSKSLGEILSDIGSVQLYNRGDADSAKPFYEHSLVIFEQLYGKEHAEVAITLNNLANAYGDLGNSERQKLLLERALYIFEKNYSKERIQIAITLTNLANAYGDFGNYARQKELLERALAIFEKHYGKYHIQVAITMTNLGNACGDLGDNKRQKELLEQALDIFEREYGSRHVQVASVLVSLGSAYGDLGEYQKKKELLERALKIEEQYYGSNHKEVATTLVSFANAYGSLGDYKKQKEILERAFSIFQRDYGKEHVQTAIVMANLGNAYGDMGNYPRQKELLEYALAVQENYYGKDHMEVAITLNNLANAYGYLGNFKHQKNLLERALTIKENYYGKNHPDVALSLINLGSAYGMLGGIQQQIEVLKRALSIFEREYGKNHILMAITLNNLGSAYGALKNYNQQADVLKQALSIEEAYYGKDHPKVSMTLTNLGNIINLGDVKLKKACLERALSIKDNYFGKEHVQFGITLANLSHVYAATKDYAKQRELLNQALRILEHHYGKEHIFLAPIYYNLSIAYANLKNTDTSHNYSKKCYQIYLNTYGIDHGDTKDAHKLDKFLNDSLSKPMLLTTIHDFSPKPIKNDLLQAHYQIPHGKDRMQAELDLFQEDKT